MKDLTKLSNASLLIAFAHTEGESVAMRDELRSRKLWTASAAVKNELDAKLVRSIGRDYDCKVGTNPKNGVFSLLTFVTPKDADDDTRQNYRNAHKTLSVSRKAAFIKPAKKAQASLTDKQHKEAAALAKFTDAQVKRILELRKQIIKQAE